ncbi:MAG: lipocalin family protein [Niabella sp.]|nr:lipocalin family protein [Niabella sp.]
MRQLQSTLLWRAGNCARFFRFITILLLMLLFMACSKKDTRVTDNGTKKDAATLLTAGQWKLDTWTWGINPADAKGESGAPVVLSSCEKDDATLFKANGEVVMDPKTVCGGDDPGAQLTTDKWEFTGDKTGIIIGTGTDAVTYTIVELTANRLKMRETYIDEGAAYVSEIVLIH